MLEDSNTGARAGLAAGMTVIMVPDLLEPDAAVLALGARSMNSLLDVAGTLEPLLEDETTPP